MLATACATGLPSLSSLVLGPRNYVTKVTLEQGCEAAAMIHQHLF